MGPIRISLTRPDSPPPGTITTDTAGELVVYLADAWPADDNQLAELVTRIRAASATTLYSPSLEVGRQVRRQIQHYGRPQPAQTVQVPKMQLPHAPEPRELCGAPRVDGTPCQSYAGAGTGQRTGPCHRHADNAVGREQQLEELAEHAARWVALNAKSDTRPLTTTEQRASLTAAKALLVARRDDLLG